MTGAKETGLTELIDDLQSVSDRAIEEVRKVVSKGALNIKQDTKKRWANLDHAPALPRAVSYGVKTTGTTVSAEIGPDKAKRQGALGNLLEYGSVNNAPIPALGPALDAEEPRFAKALEDVAAGLLEGAPSAPEPPRD